MLRSGFNIGNASQTRECYNGIFLLPKILTYMCVYINISLYIVIIYCIYISI